MECLAGVGTVTEHLLARRARRHRLKLVRNLLHQLLVAHQPPRTAPYGAPGQTSTIASDACNCNVGTPRSSL